MASSAVLELVIQLKDQATSGLGRIGQMGAGLGKWFGGAALAGLTGGVIALGGALTMAVGEASDAQQGLAQLEAVIQSTGGKAGVTKDQVLGLASSLSAANGLSRFSDDAVLAGENLLLTFTNIGKDVFPQATQAMVDMAQAMGGDPQAQAIQLGKALNDPIAGIGALSRVGVTFTDTQKDMIKAMVDAGNVAGAQKIILNELAGEFGGSAAKSAQTFSGQLITLQEKFNGILEGVGTKILPMLQQFAGFLASDTVMTGIQGFADVITEGVGAGLNYLAGTVFPAFESAFATVVDLWGSAYEASSTLGEQIGMTIDMLLGTEGTFQDLGITIEDTVGWLGEQLPKALAFVNEHWEAFRAALIAVGAVLAGAAIAGTIVSIVGLIASLANPITLIIGAIALLAAAWTEDWGGIRTATLEFWQTTGKPIFEQLVAWLQVNVPVAIAKLSDFWTNTLWPSLQKVWGFVETYVLPLIGTLVNVWFALLKKEIEILAALWTNKLWPALQKVWDFIQNNAGPAFQWFNEKVMQPLGITFDSIGTAISKTIEWFSKLAGSIDSIAIPSWLQGHSPPPLADWFGYIADAAAGAARALPSFSTSLNVSSPTAALAPVGAGSVSVGAIQINGADKSPREIALEVRAELVRMGRQNVTSGAA